MNRETVNWRGYWPAAPTPFTRDGALDESAWRGVLRLYLGQGMHGILVNGTTGEWYAQTDEERRRVAEIAMDEVGGKMTVVVGCTTYTAAQTCELARHARSIGADGILSTPPPYAAPEVDEIVEFYRTISARVDIPLMIYNWPRGSYLDMPTDLILRLADIPSVVAIKHSTPNRAHFFQTLEAVVDRIRVFGNFVNPVALAVLKEVGGDGYIGGGALLGAELPEFFELVWRRESGRAKLIAQRQDLLARQLVNPDLGGRHASNPSWLKAAMNMLGQPGGYPRPPHLPVEDPEKLAAIRRALTSVGLTREVALAG